MTPASDVAAWQHVGMAAPLQVEVSFGCGDAGGGSRQVDPLRVTEITIVALRQVARPIANMSADEPVCLCKLTVGIAGFALAFRRLSRVVLIAKSARPVWEPRLTAKWPARGLSAPLRCSSWFPNGSQAVAHSFMLVRGA